MRNHHTKKQILGNKKMIQQIDIQEAEGLIYQFLTEQPQVKKTLCLPMSYGEIADKLEALTLWEVEEAMESLVQKGVLHLTDSMSPHKLYMIRILSELK